MFALYSHCIAQPAPQNGTSDWSLQKTSAQNSKQQTLRQHRQKNTHEHFAKRVRETAHDMSYNREADGTSCSGFANKCHPAERDAHAIPSGRSEIGCSVAGNRGEIGSSTRAEPRRGFRARRRQQ